MFVLRLNVGGVSFQQSSCVADHGPGIRIMTPMLVGLTTMPHPRYLSFIRESLQM